MIEFITHVIVAVVGGFFGGLASIWWMGWTADREAERRRRAKSQ